MNHGKSLKEELLIEAFYTKLCLANSVVCDIGANTGFHTSRLLRLCPQGRVYAVEANPKHIEILSRFNSNSAFALINKAIAPSNSGIGCSVRFKISEQYHGRGGIAGMHIWEKIDKSIRFEEIMVPSILFDDFLESLTSTPLFIKMDIEGPEYSLVYSSRYLRQVPPEKLPYIAMENSVHGLDIASISFDELSKTLSVLGYILLSPQGHEIVNERGRRQAGQTVFLVPRSSRQKSSAILESSYNDIYH